MTWTKGIDPESGKPEEYDAKKQVQVYNPEGSPVRMQRNNQTSVRANMGGGF